MATDQIRDNRTTLLHQQPGRFFPPTPKRSSESSTRDSLGSRITRINQASMLQSRITSLMLDQEPPAPPSAKLNSQNANTATIQSSSLSLSDNFSSGRASSLPVGVAGNSGLNANSLGPKMGSVDPERVSAAKIATPEMKADRVTRDLPKLAQADNLFKEAKPQPAVRQDLQLNQLPDSGISNLAKIATPEMKADRVTRDLPKLAQADNLFKEAKPQPAIRQDLQLNQLPDSGISNLAKIATPEMKADRVTRDLPKLAQADNLFKEAKPQPAVRQDLQLNQLPDSGISNLAKIATPEMKADRVTRDLPKLAQADNLFKDAKPQPAVRQDLQLNQLSDSGISNLAKIATSEMKADRVTRDLPKLAELSPVLVNESTRTLGKESTVAPPATIQVPAAEKVEAPVAKSEVATPVAAPLAAHQNAVPAPPVVKIEAPEVKSEIAAPVVPLQAAPLTTPQVAIPAPLVAELEAPAVIKSEVAAPAAKIEAPVTRTEVATPVTAPLATQPVAESPSQPAVRVSAHEPSRGLFAETLPATVAKTDLTASTQPKVEPLAVEVFRATTPAAIVTNSEVLARPEPSSVLIERRPLGEAPGPEKLVVVSPASEPVTGAAGANSLWVKNLVNTLTEAEALQIAVRNSRIGPDLALSQPGVHSQESPATLEIQSTRTTSGERESKSSSQPANKAQENQEKTQEEKKATRGNTERQNQKQSGPEKQKQSSSGGKTREQLYAALSKKIAELKSKAVEDNKSIDEGDKARGCQCSGCGTELPAAQAGNCPVCAQSGPDVLMLTKTNYRFAGAKFFATADSVVASELAREAFATDVALPVASLRYWPKIPGHRELLKLRQSAN